MVVDRTCVHHPGGYSSCSASNQAKTTDRHVQDPLDFQHAEGSSYHGCALGFGGASWCSDSGACATSFERVAVCNHGEEIGGLFIGQSSDRVYVGEDVECTASIERRVVSVSFDKTDAVFVGGREGDCDHPAILPAELRTSSPEVVDDT